MANGKSGTAQAFAGDMGLTGFIKLHRGWHDSDIFSDNEVYCKRAAWVWLIEKAAWKDGNRRDPHGNLVSIKRGQLQTSSRTLAKEWGWSKNKVDRFLRDLKTDHMTDHETDRHGVLLTICNYEKYQSKKPKEKPRTDHQTDQERTIQEERERNIRNNNPPIVPPWMPLEEWNGFVAMRKEMGDPLTDRATTIAINRLDRFRNAGHDVGEILENSILNRWKGVFAPKGNSHGRSYESGNKVIGARDRVKAKLGIVESESCANDPGGDAGRIERLPRLVCAGGHDGR